MYRFIVFIFHDVNFFLVIFGYMFSRNEYILNLFTNIYIPINKDLIVFVIYYIELVVVYKK